MNATTNTSFQFITDETILLNSFKTAALNKGHTTEEAEQMAATILEMTKTGRYEEAYYRYIAKLCH